MAIPSSPRRRETGAILAINTQTIEHAQRRSKSRAAFRRRGGASANSARIVPTGLAVDGGGNLFIAYTAAGGSSDQILRLDAFSAKVTVAARGLSAPGNISFERQGQSVRRQSGHAQDSEVQRDGSRQPSGVTLTRPPATATTARQHTAISSPAAPAPPQSFELTNNTASAISGVSRRVFGGQHGGFHNLEYVLRHYARCEFQLRVQRGLPTPMPAEKSNDRLRRRFRDCNSRCATLISELHRRHRAAYSGRQRHRR